MTPDLPSRLDRATFDRVLQRAAELQAGSKDIGEGLSEEEILALGSEVGIPVEHLRQALLEERTRPPAAQPAGVIDRWVGPVNLAAQRVVQGTPDEIKASLTRWMERQENFVVQRAGSDRVAFEPMDLLAGAMRRIGAAFDPSRGKPYLNRTDLVNAQFTPLESGFVLVTLAASLTRRRRGMLGGVGALGAVGAGMAGVTLIVSMPILSVGVAAMALLGGGIIARQYRAEAARAQIGLERALDELERRPSLPGGKPPGQIARGVGQVVRDIRHEVRKAFDE